MPDEQSNAASTAQPAAAPNGGVSPDGERVAVITGGRLCAGCGFNLQDQVVLREPKYGLLIARCPECGTVAPLQEYPALGKWSRRWSMVLAVLWFAVVLLLAAGTAALPSGMATSVAWRQAQPLAKHISEAWAPTLMAAIDAVIADDGSADALSPGLLTLAQQYSQWYTSSNYSRVQMEQWINQGSVPVEEQWWKDNRKNVLATAPGLGWRWVRGEPLDDWVMRLLISFLFGAFWATILLHHRLRGRLLLGLLMTGGSLLFLWASRPDPFAGWGGGGIWNQAYYYGQTNAWTVAGAVIWPTAASASFIVVATPFFIGLIFGRPVVRLVARALLPPRLCHAIAPLWFCDGKASPRIRRVTPPEAR